MGSQLIRRSQFITTYGPGAILEGMNGPRIIPTLAQSSVFVNRNVTNFEITDSRLSNALLGGARILRVPSNAELGLPEAVDIYDTRSFPRWALCTEHGILYRKRNDQSGVACPQCAPRPNAYRAWEQ